jgi:FkbM family methyltransferase
MKPNIPDWLATEVAAYDLPFAEPPRSILDIGANIGAFTLLAQSRWPQAAIIAIEPVAANAAQFKANVNGARNIKFIPAAVRSFNGIAPIRIGDHGVTCSFHDLGRQTAATEAVECVAAAALPPCEFIKIDTEGCELEILQGLDLSQAKVVAVEYHYAADIEPLGAICESHGLKLWRHVSTGNTWGTLVFARAGALRPVAPNITPGKILIALPVYHSMEAGFAKCLMALINEPPGDIMVRMCVGDSLVSRARNSLTRDFLRSDAEYLLFLDTDLIFSPAHVASLLSRPGDIVGGLYPKKQQGKLEFVVNSHLVPKPIQPDGLQEMRYVGTGFMRIHRRVFEKMIEVYGDQLKYTPDTNPGETEYDFWSVGVYQYEDGRRRYLSEDWYFCQRALDLGFQVWADTRVQVEHVGTVVYPLQSQRKELVSAQSSVRADDAGPGALAPAAPAILSPA